jgi:hypothetical protein
MGTFVEPQLDRSEQVLKKIYEDSYGTFNQHGDFFLE